ncbi:MAG TPA: hemerythrin domain-containing protein [Steroidobacteraceae bacterium]|jgi:hemerythrin superfamily protein|nr:hemerythrin domain-containing protein [Steroidobacteraceae bacterium]
MARSTPSRASDAPRDAIALLKQDHRTVEALFDQFEDADESEQSQLAERVCQLLTVHTQIEEEILYPAAKEAFGEDEEEEDLVIEAQVEHNSAKELIARIEGMTPDDETFKATVTVLGEYVKHHVKEEENEMFPALKKSELDLKELGSQLQERKLALMEQLGIEEEEAPAAKKSTSRSSSRSASSSKSRQARAGGRSKSASSRNSGSRSAKH